MARRVSGTKAGGRSESRGPATAPPRRSSTEEPVGPRPIDEIYPLYPGEWVAVKVTALDERQAISHGEVLAHSRSRKKVSAALLRAHKEDPNVRTYVVAGGPQPGTVEEWRESLAEAAGKIKDYKDYLYAGR